jgi:glycosyltransferase involved in cell wall biosynthesis
MTPLNIALVSPGWPPDAFANGIVTCVGSIAEGLRRLGHRVFILANKVAHDYAGDDVIDLSPALAKRAGFGRVADSLAYRLSPGQARVWATERFAAFIRRTVAERNIHVLEMEESFGLAGVVKKRSATPLVVRLHGPWFINGPGSGLAGEADYEQRVRNEGTAIRMADGVTAPSRHVLEKTRSFYGLPLEGAQAIPNAMPVFPSEKRWVSSQCDPNLILFIGRFERLKGGDLIINAFARIAQTNPHARLCFVGPDRGLMDDAGGSVGIVDYLRQQVPDLFQAGRIEWMGQQPASTLPELRRKAAVCVVCSRHENFPTTVLEAMAMGCPLVATQVGGIPEIVDDGVNGLQCRSNDVEDLAQKVCRLLADRPLAENLGRRAAEDCERRYDPAILAEQTADFYRRVIAGHGAASGPSK